LAVPELNNQIGPTFETLIKSFADRDFAASQHEKKIAETGNTWLTR
jgi:hypothetical protein